MSRITLRRRVAEPQKLRATGFFAVLMALMLVLAGCGGGESQESADGKIELTVWASRSYYVPPDEFKSFMAEHPNIVIKWDVKDSDDILQQMQRMQSANQKLPDVIQDEVQLARAYHDAGVVMPIDDQMKKWQQEDAASYDLVLPSAWEEARIDGQTLGMSITANFDVLYYNTEWAKQAGVQFPVRTYDDLFAAAQKLKAARPDKFPFSIQALAGEGVTALLNMFVGAGVPFDGATPDLKSPQAQYILDWFKRARDEGLIPPDAISWGEAESRGVFVSGDAALLIDGFTTAGDFADVGGFDYGTSWSNTLLPAETGKGHSGTRASSARTWYISSGTEHPDEAGLVLRYIAATPQLVGQATHGGVPPRQTEAINSPELVKAWPFFSEDLKQAFINSTPRPSALNAGEVEDVLEQLFGEIVQGTDQSPQQLADKYQPQLDALGG